MSSSASDGFGLFMRELEEKSLVEIDRNYIGRQNVLVLREYLVLLDVQTSDMGKAYTKEKLVNLAFQAWKLRLETIQINHGEAQDSRWLSPLSVIDQGGMRFLASLGAGRLLFFTVSTAVNRTKLPGHLREKNTKLNFVRSKRVAHVSFSFRFILPETASFWCPPEVSTSAVE